MATIIDDKRVIGNVTGTDASEADLSSDSEGHQMGANNFEFTSPPLSPTHTFRGTANIDGDAPLESLQDSGEIQEEAMEGGHKWAGILLVTVLDAVDIVPEMNPNRRPESTSVTASKCS